MFEKLKAINSRPEPYEFYTAADLWAHPHTSGQMLAYHLNEAVDAASRSPDFIDRSVAWLVSRFNVDEKTKIADFGCGPGLYAHRLAACGAEVTGIDFSRNSLAYATERAAADGLAINYVNADYLSYETADRFDLVFMIMCDFCALSPVQRQKMLAKFRSVLKPSGSLLLDVYSLIAFDRKTEEALYEKNQLNGFWSPDDYYCFVNTYKYEKEKLTLDKYTIIEPGKTRTIYNWLQHYSRSGLQAELAASGFEVTEFYADVAGARYDAAGPEMAVVARPRS